MLYVVNFYLKFVLCMLFICGELFSLWNVYVTLHYCSPAQEAQRVFPARFDIDKETDKSKVSYSTAFMRDNLVVWIFHYCPLFLTPADQL